MSTATVPPPVQTRTIKVPATLYRTGTSIIDPDKETVRLSISSDIPYLRYDWMRDEEFYEVLDHSPSGMDTSRLHIGTSLLYNHDRDILLGRNTFVGVADSKAVVDAKISKAPDVESFRIKINEGILTDSSVGYTISDEGEEIGKKDGIPILKFAWQPHEASLVTIPADTSVGIGRDHNPAWNVPEDGKVPMKEIEIKPKKDIDAPTENVKRTTNSDTEPQRIQHMAAEAAVTPPPVQTPQIDVVRERNEAKTEERKRVQDITELSKHFADNGLGGRKIDTSELAGQFVKDGKTVQEFQDAVVRGNFPEPKKIDPPDVNIGMEQKDLEQYSIVRAINRLATKRPIDGVEKAAHDAYVKQTGREAEGMGFYVPFDVMSFNRGGLVQQVRTLFTNVYAAAGALVSDDLMAGSMIELLRNKLAVVKMGARTLSGLRGNVQIPLQSGGATASWLAENATISESNQTVGQLALTPHRLGAATSYTYQLLAQSSLDVENFVREDLMRVLALAKDLAAIAGTGVSGQPLGILTTTNLSTSVTLSGAQSMVYADALAFENNVALNNADLGKLGYLTTPTIRKNAKSVAEISAANSTPVWKDDKVNGFTAFATNQVPTATSVIFGNWDDLIIADWDGNQVIVDPYSLSLQGQVRVVMQQLCDNGLRHPKSFSVSTN